MNIVLKEVTVRELAENYINNEEEGVTGYNNRLNIRPPYQREFVYNDKQRNAVIDSIVKEYPLNVMYWATSADGSFEVIDGQQRTLSICQYINGDFTFNNRFFHNLCFDEQEQIYNYNLMVYVCDGTESEKLQWFKIINIVGEKLSEQELRNAVYAGEWLHDAKKYFSKSGCVAYNVGKDYLTGVPIRQHYLETALRWASENRIESYMAKHQHDSNASALWLYFQSLVTWISVTFTVKRRFMKNVDWGYLYNLYWEKQFDTKQIEIETAKLILDDDVSKKSGIYAYILTRNEKYLSIRTFTQAMKQKVYESQNGICTICNNHFEISEMESDHITPWREGGKTNVENCQVLCLSCNRRKSSN
jgi:hypothetical protein